MIQRDLGNELKNLGELCTESGQTLQCLFSAVSKPMFATKYTSEALAEVYKMRFVLSFFSRLLSFYGLGRKSEEDLNYLAEECTTENAPFYSSLIQKNQNVLQFC